MYDRQPEADALPPADSPEARAILDRLYESCRRYGSSRRQFLRAVAAGAAGTFLAACAGSVQEQEAGTSSTEQARRQFFKNPDGFIRHGARNLEARLTDLDSFLTPAESFFVRNNSASLSVDPATYRLTIDGDGVSNPIELGYDELMALPRRSIFSYIECGGNQRTFFDLVMGQTASGTQWGPGGIGMAEWSGVPMGELLSIAGVRPEAVDVQLIGLDTESPEQGWRRPLPVSVAMDADTLLALHMNGLPLPPDHGFPARAVVPGWVGSSNVKWLGRIEVSTEKVWSRNNTTSYVLIGEDYPPEGEAEGQVAQLQSIKSALALPWPAALAAGPHLLRGFAQSPHAAIATVEWSVDDGETWWPARLLEPLISHSWARFEINWDAAPGAHTVTTRATDAAGNAQPESIPFNEKGYLFNLPLPHPIRVS